MIHAGIPWGRLSILSRSFKNIEAMVVPVAFFISEVIYRHVVISVGLTNIKPRESFPVAFFISRKQKGGGKTEKKRRQVT